MINGLVFQNQLGLRCRQFSSRESGWEWFFLPGYFCPEIPVSINLRRQILYYYGIILYQCLGFALEVFCNKNDDYMDGVYNINYNKAKLKVGVHPKKKSMKNRKRQLEIHNPHSHQMKTFQNPSVIKSLFSLSLTDISYNLSIQYEK